MRRLAARVGSVAAEAIDPRNSGLMLLAGILVTVCRNYLLR